MRDQTFLLIITLGLLCPTSALCHPAGSNQNRQILQVLNAEQAQALADGVPGEELRLANGETFAEYLNRRSVRTQAALVLRQIVPCVIFDSGSLQSPLIPQQIETLRVIGNFSEGQQKQTSECNLPGFMETTPNSGASFRTPAAHSLLLNIEIFDASGAGSLKLWPTGQAEPTGRLMSFEADVVTTASSLIVPICNEESFDPCAEGDLNLWTDTLADVRVTVQGYLEPLIHETGELPLGGDQPKIRKSLVASYWEQGTNSNDIYFNDGKVGIGTDAPIWTFGLGGEEHTRIELLSDQVDMSNEVGIGFGNSDRTEYFQIGLDDDGQDSFHIGSRYFRSKYISILPNGFVGVGHRTPDSYLTVYGTAHLKSNNPTLRLSDASADPELPGAAWHVRNQNSTFKIYEGIGRSGSPELAITRAGNVGIGTGMPEYRLDLSGDMRIKSSFLKFYNSQASYPNGYHEAQFEQVNRFALSLRSPGNAFAVERWSLEDGADTIAFFDRDTGNVGIGTKSPKTPFALMTGSYQVGITQNHLGGSATMELTTEDSTGEQVTRLLMRGTMDDADIEFYRGGLGSEELSLLVDGSNGNLGVGTDAPAEKLDVAGSIRLEGNLYNDSGMEISTGGALQVTAQGDICIGRCE